VRFLGEPCNAEEIQAAGCHFVSYVHAPHRRTKSPLSPVTGSGSCLDQRAPMLKTCLPNSRRILQMWSPSTSFSTVR
jgi:hypothetical protein